MPERKRGPAFPPAPVSPDFRLRARHRGPARAFHRRHARPAPARVAGFAIRPANGEPFKGHPRAAGRPRVGHRGGCDPEGSTSHLDALAPPLPCGIGFAISVIQSCRPRKVAVSRWPRPVHAARRRHVPCVWSSDRSCAEARDCPDNPLHLCPKAPASRLVAWLVHAPGEHFPPWRPAFPMPKHARDVLDTRSVSFPSHPLSRAGQAVSRGGVPASIREFPEGTCAYRSVASF